MPESLPLRDLEVYAFADPAGSTKAQTSRLRRISARQAIVVIAADWIPRIFVVHTWAGRLTTSDFRDRIVSVYADFKPRKFGIEANAMQFLFADLVREGAKERLGTVRLIPIVQPTRVQKEYRIRTALEPVINDGRLFLQESQLELRSELQGFPTAARKDLVDALSSAINLVPKRAPAEKDDAEEKALAAYLRKTGVSPYLIEERIQRLRRSRIQN
jgi:hypothetical protein